MELIMIFKKDSLGTTNYSRECCKCQMQIVMFAGIQSHFTVQHKRTTVLKQGRTLHSDKRVFTGNKLIESYRPFSDLLNVFS